MKRLGIDIGTTTITTVIVEDEKLLEVNTLNNEFLDKKHPYEMMQDPNLIYRKVIKELDYFYDKYEDIESIGVTGQMHGIVYVDSELNALSPLYTWCDQRSAEVFKNNNTYVEHIKRITGMEIAVGYGLASHFFNINNEKAFKNVDYKIMTIHDFVAHKLASATNFYIHASNAASFGLYKLESNSFNEEALEKLGIDKNILPIVTTKKKILGSYNESKVYVAIGDNQASFLGSTNHKNALLVNVGTGSQVSCRVNELKYVKSIETRPYLNDDYLLVGASICGGKAFETLARLFSEISGKSLEETYNDMTNVEYKETDLVTLPTFLGTRENNKERGSINNISLTNFNKSNLVISMLEGMTKELHNFYKLMDVQFDTLVVSGNGVRKNKLLMNIIEKMFEKKANIGTVKEEAAYGAAIYTIGD